MGTLVKGGGDDWRCQMDRQKQCVGKDEGTKKMKTSKKKEAEERVQVSGGEMEYLTFKTPLSHTWIQEKKVVLCSNNKNLNK